MAAPQQAAAFDSEELRLLHQIACCLLRECEYGELLNDLLDLTINALGATRGFVLVREGANVQATAARNFRSEALDKAEEMVSTSIALEVLAAGKTLLISDARSSEQFRDKKSVRRLDLRSVLCAALVTSSETFALLYLESLEADGFTENHRRLLDEICSMSSPRLKVAINAERLRKRASELESRLGEGDGILTADERMIALLKTVKQVSATDLPVLIQGETGTGKELVARALYRHSKRTAGPFLVLNCGAVPATLIESELFGYLRGAFSGAVRDRMGIVGAANRGTLFLDEIGELPLDLQTRLLRVLQSGEFTRIGSVQPEFADIRFIAATNRDLEREVEAGRFRSDLYYRLSGIVLQLPPLRERRPDIPLLATHFLNSYSGRWARPALKLSADAIEALIAYQFPGNVRELENEMARLVALSSGESHLPVDALNQRIRTAGRGDIETEEDSASFSVKPMSLSEMERLLILRVLQETGGNQTQAAEILAISREGLRNKMQRLRLKYRGEGAQP
ncbi:MAG TPA: sigma-54-dependent Fis family transcriptional regulator [Candidatus Angelobacter sp.]|nr:sigma-54-dependent Fis family transcriptional regulator [Candidatus Angelobacter sp.]